LRTSRLTITLTGSGRSRFCTERGRVCDLDHESARCARSSCHGSHQSCSTSSTLGSAGWS
jgi:hypothetical protein